jgi:hypothetical protein
MGISAIVGLANIAMLFALLSIYAKIYKSTRAVFTIGLMFFSGLLMLHNIITVYAYFAMEPFYAQGLLPYIVVISIAELAGIAALLRVTLS